MNENQSPKQEIENTIQRVLEAETDNFFELAKMLGRDPKHDLAGADLHNCDLSNGDLRSANLRKTNLSGANLSGTDLREADLMGADLTGANLSNTQLNEIIVLNTLFSKNKGLSLENQQYLQEKGAIFEELETLSLELVYQYEPSFIGFLKYIFLGEKEQIKMYQEPIPKVARVKMPRTAIHKNANGSNRSDAPFNFTIIMFSWLLGITFLATLGYIIYQGLILKSERASIVIYHAFTLILGCFVGALTTYLKMASEQKML